MERGIVAAACQVGEVTISMPAPARHHDILRAMDAMGIQPGSECQGFLDHRGVFLGRKTAKIKAADFGQVEMADIDRQPMLFSEDLW